MALATSNRPQNKATATLTPHAWEFVVLLIFAISRLGYFAAGLRFNAAPVATFWQMIDPELMRTDLLRSIWYLHMQPPGYNLLIGLVVKFFPDHYGAVLWGAQIAAGAAIAICLFRLTCWLGVPAAWSGVLTSIFIISPGCLMYEDLASYEYWVLLVLLLSALALARFCESPATSWAAAFFGCLLVLALVRNAFHIVYLLAVAAGLLWFMPAARRAILIGAVPAILILGGIYVKNGILFGRFVSSTWAGMATGVTTSFHLTEEEADDLVNRGIVTPLAKIPPFSPLTKYEAFIHRPAKTGIPVLDQDATSTGHDNFNNLAYLQVHELYVANSKQIWRHYPLAYLRSLSISWFSYFRPASDFEYFDTAPDGIQSWEGIFSAVVFGQMRRTDDRETFLELAESGHGFSRVLYTGMFLLILIPAIVIWGAIQLATPGGRKRWTLSQFAVLAFLLFTIVYLSLVSTLVSSFDGNRYRFPLDGFFIALFGAMLVQLRDTLAGPRTGDNAGTI